MQVGVDEPHDGVSGGAQRILSALSATTVPGASVRYFIAPSNSTWTMCSRPPFHADNVRSG